MVSVSCIWTIKEKLWYPISHKIEWREAVKRKNTFTTYGLTALASAISGGYTPPVNLIIENNTTVIPSTFASGVSSIQLTNRIDQVGDTQIILSLGGVLQETVTFTGVSGSGPYTYTLSTPTANNHNSGDLATRQVGPNDTMSSIMNEVQYDPVNSPNLRISAASGYSSGVGNWASQFYMTATMAQSYISSIGLTDNDTLTLGQLHNHVVLGYDHSSGTFDIQVEGTLTLTNV